MKQTRLLLLLLLASLLPASTYAAVYGDKFTIDDYTYYISDVSKHEVYISNCTASGDVTLPSTVTDKNHIEWTVKGLIFGVFKNVTGITIPEGYTTIGINVFQHSQITTLNIPASVTTIERGSFMGVDKLQSITVNPANPNFTAENGVLYNKTKTELICYPKGKTDEDFTVPDGVTKIMGLAFFQNPNIKTVTLPTSVSELDPYTLAPFAGYSAFTDCASLTAINVKSGNPTFKSVDGVVYSADDKTLAMYPSGKEMDPFIVPSTVEHIAQSAFLYTKKLKNITISEGVKDIGAYAFKNSGIKSASIPASVTSISDGTFAREFDVDFSDYKATTGHTDVAAFVAGSPLKAGGGDYGTSTYHIKMTSIDEKGGVSGNYGYVPANTSVLLKVLDKESTGADFYYTIGEKDNQTYTVTPNIMTGVTVNPTTVAASTAAPVYVMQEGVFRKVTADITEFPVHKAYFKVGSLPAGAKAMLVFDDGSTTGIGSLTADDNDKGKNANVYYNLNGQRVGHPHHGVFIHNGKKVVIK